MYRGMVNKSTTLTNSPKNSALSAQAWSSLKHFARYSPLRCKMLTVSLLALTVSGGMIATVAAQDATSTDGAIGTVKIQGDATQSTVGPNVGANGSSDSGATEGTGSLTADTTTVSSKMALSLRETPQSVSVITDQRLKDQQLNDITQVLQQAPGISVVYTDSQLNPTYYSRGFAITTYQIDGGAPLSFGGYEANQGSPNSPFTPTFDLAQYDRVEIVRGSDGVNVGTGQPGGVISLQRKRPVAGQQILISGLGGSYSQQRGTFDVSTPLFASPMFRLRVIGIHDNNNYFYNTAYRHKNSVSANLEFDPFDTTQINVGATYENQTALPAYGLPRGSDGSSLGVKRSTCLCAPWNYASASGPTYFVELHQGFTKDWNLTSNLSAIQQKTFSNSAYVTAGYTGILADGSGAYVTGSGPTHTSTLAYSADTHLDGAFDILGHRQQITVGGAYTFNKYQPNGNSSSYNFTDFPTQGSYGTIANIFNFNPNTIPMNTSDTYTSSASTLSASTHQYAAYALVRLSPWDPLHITISDRFTAYGNSSVTSYTNPGQDSYTTGSTSRQSVLPFPNFAVTYDIFPKTTTVYASRESIFSTSQAYTKEGKQVAPLTGATYEVGLKRSDFNGTLNSSVGFYLANQVNLPVSDPSVPDGSSLRSTIIGCCYLSGSDKNTSKGVDVEVSGAVTQEIQAQASYTFNTNKFQPGPDQAYSQQTPLISQAPKHQVKLFTTYQPSSGMFHNVTFGFSARYQTTTYARGTSCSLNGTNCAPYNFTQSPYAIFDALVKYNINKNMTAQLNVTNLFDRTYYATVGTPSGGNYYGQPRSFTLALNASF